MYVEKTEIGTQKRTSPSSPCWLFLLTYLESSSLTYLENTLFTQKGGRKRGRYGPDIRMSKFGIRLDIWCPAVFTA